MEKGIEEQKLAVSSGYYPIFRYNSKTKEFNLDMKEPNFDLLDEFIDNETRFKALKIVNKERAEELFKKLKEDVKERYKFYENMKKSN